MDICRSIQRYIDDHQLLSHDKLYLLGLSGGPDSVALFRVLLQLGYPFEALHCNFRLRGDESDRDEQFCVSLCQRHDVKLHRIHFDTFTYADLHHVSIEMAARDLRYHYFAEMLRDIGAEDVVIAHHQDDLVETVLLNLTRGTGLHGLLGIKPRNGHIVRPMLCVRRQDILSYLDSLQQDYVTDSTNLKDDAKRNVMRHQVVPVLEKLNPSFSDKVALMTRHLTQVADTIDALADQWVEKARRGASDYSLDQLRQAPSAELAFWQLLGNKGFTTTQSEEIAHCQQSGRYWLSDDYVALVHRKLLLLRDRKLWDEQLPTLRIPETGYYAYGQNRHFRLKLTDYVSPDQISRDPLQVTLDASTVVFPLTIRPLQEGDRFVPFGMKNSKLVSDYLTDRHASLLDKRRQLVVADKSGRIVWLVGRSVDARCAVNKETTKKILIIKSEMQDAKESL